MDEINLLKLGQESRMYYGPRGNRIHSWLLPKKSHHRYVGTLLVIVAIVVAWTIFLYQPLNCLIDIETQNIISAQERSANGIIAQKKCQELEQKLKENKQFLESATQTSAKAEQDYLTFLVDQAQKSGIILSSCSRAHEGKRDGLEYCSLTCRLCSTFECLLRFFDNIVQSGKHIGCSHLALISDSDKSFDISCRFDYVTRD